MAAKPRTWTCQRRAGGVKCGHVNPKRLQLCAACGKRKRPSKRAEHLAALDVEYAAWVEEFGEQCGICGKPRTATRRLDRDHVHRGSGFRRGLLCWRCNIMLDNRVTAAWLRAAAEYVARFEERVANGP